MGNYIEIPLVNDILGTTGLVAFWNSLGNQITGGNLFWDATNNRLGVNNLLPAYALDVVGDINLTGVLRINGASAAILTGTGTSGQVSYWSGTNSQVGDAGLTYTLNNLTLGDSNDSPIFSIKSKTGNAGSVEFFTASSLRWLIGKSSVAETGSNAGSGLVINSYDDTGTLIDTPLSFLRSGTSVIDIRRSLSLLQYSAAALAVPTGVVSAGGSVDNGAHLYVVTPRTSVGQGLPTAASATITTTAGQNTVTLTIPVMANSAITDRGVYRTKAGGSEYFFVGNVGNNTSVTFVDTTADSALTNLKPPVTGSYTSGFSTNFTLGNDATAMFLKVGATNSQGSAVIVNGSAGYNKSLRFFTGNSPRWILQSTSTAESGANVGSNLSFDAYDDSGTLISSPLVINRAGTSTIDTTRSITFSQYSAAALAVPTGVVSSGGAVDTGNHLYKMAPYTAVGEGLPTSASATITTTGGNNTVTLTIPVCASANISDRAIYRTKAGGSEYFFVGLVGNNTSTSYVDTTADASLVNRKPQGTYSFTSGIGVSASSIGSAGSLIGLQLGAATSTGVALLLNSATATTRYIAFNTANSLRWALRCENSTESGSNAGSLFTLNSYDDTGASIDSVFSIGRSATSAITIPRNLTLTAINATSTAITGTATSGGAVNDGDHLYKMTYVTSTGETGSNTASAIITMGGGNNTGTLTIPVGASIYITDRAIYRTKAGGSVYFFVGLVGNNTSTSYVDTTADASLTFRCINSVPTTVGFTTPVALSTTTGSLGNATNTGCLVINGPTASLKTIRLQTMNGYRWMFGADATAESGSNTGSLFYIASYDDNGLSIDKPLTIARDASGTIMSVRNFSFTQVGAASTAITGTVSSGGAVDTGDHLYKMTYISAGGETGSNNASATITTTAGDNTISLIVPVSTSIYVTNRAIYRTKAGGSVYYFLGLMGDNTTTSLIDVTADASLTLRVIHPNPTSCGFTTPSTLSSTYAQVGSATSAGYLMINGQQGQAKSVRFLSANGFRWIVGANSTTDTGSNAGSNFTFDAYDDTGSLLDSPLTIGRTTTEVIRLGRSITFTGVTVTTTAPTGVIAAGGAVDTGDHYYKVSGITGNGETTASSASLVQTTTAGNNTVNLTIALMTSKYVTSRAIYRTKAGTSAPYYYLATIADNTTTTYSDVTADASLTIRQPLTATYGIGVASACTFTGIPMFGTATGATNLIINGPTATNKGIYFYNSNTTRWYLASNSTADSGSNAGSNLSLNSYDDVGSFIDTPLVIYRASGGSITWSAGRSMGIGINPTAKLHLDSGNATASALKLTAGTTTGVTATDGCEFGIDTSGNCEIRQRENLPINIFTNNTARANFPAAGGFVVTAGFGCNGTTAQTAYASGGALAAYGAGANGFDTAGNASALYAMVVAIRAALVANGIMS